MSHFPFEQFRDDDPDTLQILQEEMTAEAVRSLAKHLHEITGIEIDVKSVFLTEWLIAQQQMYPPGHLAAVGGPLGMLAHDPTDVEKMLARLEDRPYNPDEGMSRLARERDTMMAAWRGARADRTIMGIFSIMLLIAWAIDHFLI